MEGVELLDLFIFTSLVFTTGLMLGWTLRGIGKK